MPAGGIAMSKKIWTENRFLHHLIAYQRLYVVVLAIIILSIPLLQNLSRDQPVLFGPESYYNLGKAAQPSLMEFYYYPLSFAQEHLPEDFLIAIPFLLAISCLILFQAVARRIALPLKLRFVFTLLLIISPAFIYALSTLTIQPYFIFLILSGFLLLTSRRAWMQYASVLPFFLATFIDLLSTILTALFLLNIIYLKRRKHQPLDRTVLFSTILASIMLFIQSVILKQPLFIGPFHVQQYIPNLISDLGGFSGVSFFLLLLSIVGISVTWKKEGHLIAYLLLPLVLGAYYLSSQAIFHLAILLAFFAAVGLISLLEREWELPSLKKVTMFLLLMGLLFSTISYLDRIDEHSPTTAERESLLWLRENMPKNSRVLSAPENAHYIRYIGGREPLYHLENAQTLGDAPAFQANYVQELFPILEGNNTWIVYLTPAMKEKLPPDYGFLFLLKNERFKMAYSLNDVEVWEFKEPE